MFPHGVADSSMFNLIRRLSRRLVLEFSKDFLSECSFGPVGKWRLSYVLARAPGRRESAGCL